MKIGVIGTGNMGGAMLTAFAAAGEYELLAYNRGRDKLMKMCEATGAKPMESAVETARESDFLLLAVKPQNMPDLLDQIAPVLRPEQLIVTAAAGLPLSLYETHLGADKKLTRTIPNTPARVRAGMTPLCFGQNMTEADKLTVCSVLQWAGGTEEIPEHLMDAACTLTGCSPAFVFMFLEAMADGAVSAGIPRAQAYRMAAQAVLGSAKLMLETGEHPGALKDAVCSPAGTTIQGVAKLEECGFRTAVIQAMDAATNANKAMK